MLSLMLQNKGLPISKCEPFFSNKILFFPQLKMFHVVLRVPPVFLTPPDRCAPFFRYSIRNPAQLFGKESWEQYTNFTHCVAVRGFLCSGFTNCVLQCVSPIHREWRTVQHNEWNLHISRYIAESRALYRTMHFRSCWNKFIFRFSNKRTLDSQNA